MEIDYPDYDLEAIKIYSDKAKILNQLLLPDTEEWLTLSNYEEVILSIVNMSIRGAPLIGAIAAMGMYFAVLQAKHQSDIACFLKNAYTRIIDSRPTARELSFRANQVYQVAQSFIPSGDLQLMARECYQTVLNIFSEGIETSNKIIRNGLLLFTKKCSVLTHCNTGSLAVIGKGTALGIIKEAYNQKLVEMVYADETRPYLQGTRLTSYELWKEKIPHRVIVDSSAPYLMKRGLIDMVIVGADRISTNYDVANKIGTYSLALAAFYHKIPFYVAAPVVTIDTSIKTGDEITIEERNQEEVLFFRNKNIAPIGVSSLNYSFDVTPANLITAIITEQSIIYPDANNFFSEV